MERRERAACRVGSARLFDMTVFVGQPAAPSFRQRPFPLFPAVPRCSSRCYRRCSPAVISLFFNNSGIAGNMLITDQKIGPKFQHNSGEK
ncbi:hypothetical protein ABC974_10990 [Sphingomonas oligophenolica]|uniref:Uncharacterized protein n=1 Tax=Sphingomonas oligophenolica TaxID=301154 RepID=A0ABU9Y2W7_9SPHN